MGKLSELKAERDGMDWDHPDRISVEKKINDIEEWCMSKGVAGIKRVTTWTKGDGKKKDYWHCHSYTCCGRVLNMNIHTECRNCGKQRHAKNQGYA
jgi:hypothetical protein